MGLGKFIARKGAVGGTARWVADVFFGALANNTINVQNCSSPAGLNQEIDKLVQFALAVRFQNNPTHSHAEEINKYFKNGVDKGLLGFTIAILTAESGYLKNTTANMIMFDEIIVEELRKKNVGEALITGEVIS